MDWLAGKKTYLTALAIGVLAAAQALGYPVPEWVYGILGALGLGTLRPGVANEVKKLESGGGNLKRQKPRKGPGRGHRAPPSLA